MSRVLTTSRTVIFLQRVKRQAWNTRNKASRHNITGIDRNIVKKHFLNDTIVSNEILHNLYLSSSIIAQ